MKTIILTCTTLFLLTTSSCGQRIGPTGLTGPQGAPATVTADVSILSKFEPTSAPVVVPAFDLSALTLNSTASSDLVITCDGSFGNSGLVNGVAAGNLRITGTAQKGSIQFGHTKYVGASDAACRDVSKEQYLYSVEGDILTLCISNPAYPYCTNYKQVL